MIYAMRAAARRQLPIIVLDRPNPITGDHVDGPMLDSGAGERRRARRAQRPGEAVRIISVPAAARNDDGRDGAASTTPCSASARRCTSCPWPAGDACDVVRRDRAALGASVAESADAHERARSIRRSWPSRDRTSRVGRGTPRRVPALRRAVAARGRASSRCSTARQLPGVRFERRLVHAAGRRATASTPGARIPGVRIVRHGSRSRITPGRTGAAILWALARDRAATRCVVRAATFDERFGSPAMREALLRGEDPDASYGATTRPSTTGRRAGGAVPPLSIIVPVEPAHSHCTRCVAIPSPHDSSESHSDESRIMSVIGPARARRRRGDSLRPAPGRGAHRADARRPPEQAVQVHNNLSQAVNVYVTSTAATRCSCGRSRRTRRRRCRCRASQRHDGHASRRSRSTARAPTRAETSPLSRSLHLERSLSGVSEPRVARLLRPVTRRIAFHGLERRSGPFALSSPVVTAARPSGRGTSVRLGAA